MLEKLPKKVLQNLINNGELIPMNENPLRAGKPIDDPNAFAGTSWITYQEAEKDLNEEILSALLDMVSQYLTVEEEYDGVNYRFLAHDFMTAGENALDLLEKLGYVKMWDKNPTHYVFTNKINGL